MKKPCERIVHYRIISFVDNSTLLLRKFKYAKCHYNLYYQTDFIILIIYVFMMSLSHHHLPRIINLAISKMDQFHIGGERNKKSPITMLHLKIRFMNEDVKGSKTY